MKNVVKILFLFSLLEIIVFLPLQAQAKTKVAVPVKVRVRSRESNKLKVTWNKVKKADGYQIYEYRKSTAKFTKIAETGSKATSWKSKKTKTVHTYKVRAYKKVGKKKVYSKFSYPVSAKPYKKNAKLVNAGTLRFKEDVLDLSVHQCLTPTLSVKPTRYAKNSKAQIYDTTIRWSSSDESIAIVDKNGTITTQGKEGNCKIYARAHNGNVTWIKVYAEDYATNITFRNVQAMVDEMQSLIHNYQTDLEQIAAYFEENKANHPREDQQMTFTLNEERTKVVGTVDSGSGIEYGKVEAAMLRVLQSYPGDMEIIVMDEVVCFCLNGFGAEHADLNYVFLGIEEEEENSHCFKTADRWGYYYTGLPT